VYPAVEPAVYLAVEPAVKTAVETGAALAMALAGAALAVWVRGAALALAVEDRNNHNCRKADRNNNIRNHEALAVVVALAVVQARNHNDIVLRNVVAAACSLWRTIHAMGGKSKRIHAF